MPWFSFLFLELLTFTGQSIMTDVVWSVVLLIFSGLTGTGYVILYILHDAHKEWSDGKYDTTKPKELLQLQSDGDCKGS